MLSVILKIGLSIMYKTVLSVVTFLSLFFFLIGSVFSTASAQNSSPAMKVLTMKFDGLQVANSTVTGSVAITPTTQNFAKAYLSITLFSSGARETVEGSQTSIQNPGDLITYATSQPFSVTPNIPVTRSFSLPYPGAVASGNYRIVAELLSEDGTSQGITSSIIQLVGSNSFLGIDAAACTITVGGVSFIPMEGPLIPKNQTGTFRCEVTNTTNTSLQVVPHMVYAVNSVTQENGEKQQTAFPPVTLPAGATQAVTFSLPTKLDPQVYEGLFSLQTADKKTVSAVIPLRWIIPGASAVIRSVSLDRAYYQKDSTAKVSVLALPSVDLSWHGPASIGVGFSSTTGTQLTNPILSVTIRGEGDALCGEKQQALPSTEKQIYWPTQQVAVPISQECKDPRVLASVSEKGIAKPLASSENGAVTTATAGISGTNNTTRWIVWGILVVAIAAGIVWYVWKKRRKTPPPPPAQVTSGPAKNPPVGMSIMVALALLLSSTGMIPKTVAQTVTPTPTSAFAPITGVVKQPVNTQDASTQTVTQKKLYAPGGPNPLEWANVRDFSQNNTGGDSSVSVSSDCKTITVTVNGTVGSEYMCVNWGTGITLANFVDARPVNPTGVSSSLNNAIVFPHTLAANIFNSYTTYGPHMVTAYDVGNTKPKSLTYTLTNPNGWIGDHLLQVQAAISQSVVHAAGIERFYSSFDPASGADQNCGGSQPCFIQLQYRFSCGVPPTPTPGPACNSACTRAGDCVGDAARDGCTACLPKQDGSAGKTCQKQACNARCETRDDCAADAVKNGNACTECVADATGEKRCQPAPTPTPTPILTCNKECTTAADCAQGIDDCKACLPDNTGTKKVCRPVPACGTACTRNDQCAGARNNCTFCGPAGKCTAFSEDMCKCDGMDFAPAKGGTTFFPGDDVSFIAYGKVEGSDINVANLQSMQLSMYQSTLKDPNKATRIAQSAAITPQIVQNDASKVRYKVTWNQKIPSTVPSGSLFRVQATIKCAPKPGVLGAATTGLSSNYYLDLVKTIQGMLGNTKAVLQANTQQQQANSFFPGAKIAEKSCTVLKFYFE